MQTSARPASGLGLLDSYIPLGGNQTRLYYALREAVPIIDAAIFKTVRLTGGFEVRCADERLQHKLDNFVRNVPVGGNQCGLESFVSTYFEQLLTCGTAVGEMVTDADGHIAALFNSPLENIELRRASDGVGVDIFSARASICRRRSGDPSLYCCLCSTRSRAKSAAVRCSKACRLSAGYS